MYKSDRLGVILFVLGLTIIAFGSLVLVWAGYAYADAGADPGLEVNRLVDLWQGGQVLQAIMLAVLGLLWLARKKLPWLQVGNRMVYVTAAIAGVGVVVEALERGTTPTLGLIATAGFSALMILIRMPNQAPNPAPTPKEGEAS